MVCSEQIDYPAFEKNFYIEHDDIVKLSPQELNELRKTLGIKVQYIKHVGQSGPLMKRFLLLPYSELSNHNIINSYLVSTILMKCLEKMGKLSIKVLLFTNLAGQFRQVESTLTHSLIDFLRKKCYNQIFLLQVSGAMPCKPCISFAHFGFDEQLMSCIRKSEYTQPTPIQAQV